MEPRYNARVATDQTLPLLWLLSDARNDARLEDAIDGLPPGSGFVFRHYHLDPAARHARFRELAARARSRDHLVILADRAETAREWNADGVYGDAWRLPDAEGLVRLGTAHDGTELQAAIGAGADGVFLSPVFPTASHPDAPTLGVHGFHVLAQQSPRPVIALGGMDAEHAALLDWPRWGAIDGLA